MANRILIMGWLTAVVLAFSAASCAHRQLPGRTSRVDPPGPPAVGLHAVAREVVGVVVNDSTGARVSTAQVWLVVPAGSTDSVLGRGATVIDRRSTDSLGVFRLHAPQAGTYVLHARGIGYQAWNRRISVLDGTATIQLIRMVLAEPIDRICTASIEPGIVVRVIDAATRHPIGDRAVGTVKDGTYVDSLVPYGSSGMTGQLVSLRAADERPGTYTVYVERPGYQAWSLSGVEVERGECHVRTVQVDAPLERL